MISQPVQLTSGAKPRKPIPKHPYKAIPVDPFAGQYECSAFATLTQGATKDEIDKDLTKIRARIATVAAGGVHASRVSEAIMKDSENLLRAFEAVPFSHRMTKVSEASGVTGLYKEARAHTSKPSTSHISEERRLGRGRYGLYDSRVSIDISDDETESEEDISRAASRRKRSPRLSVGEGILESIIVAEPDYGGNTKGKNIPEKGQDIEEELIEAESAPKKMIQMGIGNYFVSIERKDRRERR